MVQQGIGKLSLTNHAYIIVPHSSLQTLVPDRINKHPCKQCRGESTGAEAPVWATRKRSWTCYLHSLILSSSGGMGKDATVFYKWLASMLSEKRGIQYSKMMGWLHCQLSFACYEVPWCVSGEPGHFNTTRQLSLFKVNSTEQPTDKVYQLALHIFLLLFP